MDVVRMRGGLGVLRDSTRPDAVMCGEPERLRCADDIDNDE